MPGVLDIITNENADRLQLSSAARQPMRFSLLQSNEILYHGQHIGMVVGETSRQARAAAAKVVVRYQPAEAVAMPEAEPGRVNAAKQLRNGQSKAGCRIGDPERALARAAVSVDATWQTPFAPHDPMEPHAAIAHWVGDRLTVWTATQGVSGARETMAGLFGLPKKNVTLICPFVAGGTGAKGNIWPSATLAAMAARRVQRPVKLELTREQMVTAEGDRPRAMQRVRLGADRDGKLLAISHAGLARTARPRPGEFAEPVALASRMLYACDNVSASHQLISVNQASPAEVRGTAEAAINFALSPPWMNWRSRLTWIR